MVRRNRNISQTVLVKPNWTLEINGELFVEKEKTNTGEQINCKWDKFEVKEVEKNE